MRVVTDMQDCELPNYCASSRVESFGFWVMHDDGRIRTRGTDGCDGTKKNKKKKE
jgi:hypothetical protein